MGITTNMKSARRTAKRAGQSSKGSNDASSGLWGSDWWPLVVAGLGVLLLGAGLKANEVYERYAARRQAAKAIAVYGSLMSLNTAQSLFREGDKDHDGRYQYAQSLGELTGAGLLDAEDFDSSSGYRFVFTPVRSDEFEFRVLAEPLQPGGRSLLATANQIYVDRADVDAELGPIHFGLLAEEVPSVTRLLERQQETEARVARRSH